MKPRVRFLADLAAMLLTQQALQSHRVHRESLEPKDILVSIQESVTALAVQIQGIESVESVLARIGDLLLDSALLADAIQTHGTVLSRTDQDVVKLGEWLMAHAPHDLEQAGSPVAAALTILESMVQKGKVH